MNINKLFEEFYKSIEPDMRPHFIQRHDYETQREFWFGRFAEALRGDRPSLQNQSYTELPLMWLAGRKSKIEKGQ